MPSPLSCSQPFLLPEAGDMVTPRVVSLRRWAGSGLGAGADGMSSADITPRVPMFVVLGLLCFVLVFCCFIKEKLKTV